MAMLQPAILEGDIDSPRGHGGRGWPGTPWSGVIDLRRAPPSSAELRRAPPSFDELRRDPPRSAEIRRDPPRSADKFSRAAPNAIAQPTMMMARFAVFATEWVTPEILPRKVGEESEILPRKEWVTPEILPMAQESDLIRPPSCGRPPEISAVSRLHLG